MVKTTIFLLENLKYSLCIYVIHFVFTLCEQSLSYERLLLQDQFNYILSTEVSSVPTKDNPLTEAVFFQSHWLAHKGCKVNIHVLKTSAAPKWAVSSV